jgi:hypothetical protein
MKTSWSDIQIAEDYLEGKLNPQDKLVVDAQLIINPGMRLNITLQQKIHKLTRAFGRKKIKAEIESVHHRLFNDPDKTFFRESVHHLFIKE